MQNQISITAASTTIMFMAPFALADVTFEFTPVARVGDAMPGGGTLTGISTDDPAFGEGLLAFEAPVSTVNGFFVGDANGVTRINFTGNTRPDGGNFSSPGDEGVIDGGLVSFERASGIFLAPLDGLGPITAIADFNTTVRDSAGNPVGGASFTSFGDYGRDGSVTAFEARRTGNIEGIYRDISGSLRLLLEAGDPSPFGVGSVTNPGEPFVRDGGVVFNVRDDQDVQGIVGDFGGGPGVNLAVLVDTNTASPSGLGNFTGFGEIAFDGDLMVFQATTALGSNGIYMLDRSTSTLSVIADSTVPAPGTAMNFAGGVDPSISGTNVIFQSTVDGVGGLHLWADGTLHKVAQAGDTVLGGTVAGTENRVPYAIEGNRFGVRLTFSDAPDGYFIGEIDVCPADLNDNGAVDVTDLLALLSAWGTPDGDTNNDGTTDVTDLLNLLTAWGSCP